MKTLLKSILFAVITAFGVPAFAAPENHEEFARQYMPESQALFERFRKDCAETQKLRESLAEDLRVMNRALDDDAGYCALSEKITELEKREAEWADTIKDAFFKHKAGMATSEKLSETDAVLAKSAIAWENDILKNSINNSILRYKQDEQTARALVVVKIPGKNYAFGKYEVTQWQYQMVLGHNPSYFKGKALPVEMVDRDDARIFCKVLTLLERAWGVISDNQEYRLPTSAEWEYAYGEGDTHEGWSRGRKTHPVGGKIPNAFGIYDMKGNVSEWVEANYDPGTTRQTEGDGCGNHTSGFSQSPIWERYSYHEIRYPDIGFRVVLAPVEKAN